jgi:hypothetical protein
VNLIVEGVAGDDSAVFFLSFTLKLPELIDRPKRFVRLRTSRAVLPGAAIARRLNMHDPFLNIPHPTVRIAPRGAKTRPSKVVEKRCPVSGS